MEIKKPKNSGNLQYLIAVVIMSLFGVVGIIMIVALRPNQDNIALITLLIGTLTPTTLSLLAFMKAQETHLSVNSRLDAFIKQSSTSAKAEGRIQGRKEANARTDALAKKNIKIAKPFQGSGDKIRKFR